MEGGLVELVERVAAEIDHEDDDFGGRDSMPRACGQTVPRSHTEISESSGLRPPAIYARRGERQAYLQRTAVDAGLETAATIADVQAALQAIPKLISVALDPEGSSNQLEAAVRDIVQKVATKKRAEFDKRKEDKVPPTPGSSDKTAPTSSAQIEVSIVKGE